MRELAEIDYYRVDGEFAGEFEDAMALVARKLEPIANSADPTKGEVRVKMYLGQDSYEFTVKLGADERYGTKIVVDDFALVALAYKIQSYADF